MDNPFDLYHTEDGCLIRVYEERMEVELAADGDSPAAFINLTPHQFHRLYGGLQLIVETAREVVDARTRPDSADAG